MKEDRDKIVGLLLEQFLNKGLGSIRSMCEQSFIYGQQEAFARGRSEGTEARSKLHAESMEHMNKWQKDREELMRIAPGYKYKNRVDDEEWVKAKAAIIASLRPAKPTGDDR